MNHLENKIEEARNEALKQIEIEKVIINILDGINPYPQCSAINDEHLYSAAELECIFKIRRDKKEQFQNLLNISESGRRINLNIYYYLPAILDYLPGSDSLATLTYYFDDRGGK